MDRPHDTDSDGDRVLGRVDNQSGLFHENPKFEARNSKQIPKIHHPDRQTVRGF